jgi:uncharacterized membrane protein
MQESLKALIQQLSLVFEVVGSGIILGGFVAALWSGGRMTLAQGDMRRVYDRIRSVFGRSVLLGLEVLVAADIIRTVAVEPTLQNLYVLALLVLIRTFLSWSLDVELDGVLPWQKRRLEDEERLQGVAKPPRD